DDGSDWIDACIVVESVQLSICFHALLDDIFCVFKFCYITSYECCITAVRANHFNSLFSLDFIYISRDDLCPFFGEVNCCCSSHPRGGSSDNNYFAFESAGHGGPIGVTSIYACTFLAIVVWIFIFSSSISMPSPGLLLGWIELSLIQ